MCLEKMPLLKVGDQAPDFTLKSDNNTSVSLSNFHGRVVVLYFYPKDFTTGCTKEACAFRDDFAEFRRRDIAIIGISYDKPEEHEKFKMGYNLPFILLSDEDKQVSKMYGADGLLVAKRVTYIIDKDGKIVAIYPKVDVNSHSKEILEFITSRMT
jgi:peroxiredoxin Q/BCP